MYNIQKLLCSAVWKQKMQILEKDITLQKGQALLIVILVMVVALTVGLSVAVRTITNIRTSSEDENSERAFSAAEAGIEQSLLSEDSVPLTSLANNTSYSSTVSSLSGSEFIVNNGVSVLKNEPVDVWLSTYSDYSAPWSGSLSVNWGSTSNICDPAEGGSTMAALEIVVISGTKAAPKTTSYLLDSCPSRAANNKFESVTTVGNTINGKTFAYSKTLTISSGLIVRIIPLYSSTDIGIQKGASDPALPTQGTVVTSEGISGNTRRKIVSFRPHPKLPAELFPFIFFSPK